MKNWHENSFDTQRIERTYQFKRKFVKLRLHATYWRCKL